MFKEIRKRLSEGQRLRRLPAGRIQEIQLELLRDHLVRASKSPFYRDLFRRTGLSPLDIKEEMKDLSDLSALPFTERRHLEQGWDLFMAVEPGRLADLVQTSGTTGRPVKVGYSERDLDRLAFNEAMAFSGAGVSPGSRVLLCVTMDRCFIAGLAYYLGARALGCGVVRSGPGGPDLQLALIEEFRPDVVVGVPSFLSRLARKPGAAKVLECISTLICIGEPVRDRSLEPNRLGRELAEGYGASVISTYAGTEIQTCFCECSQGSGGHVHPELAVIEVVDHQGRQVRDGELGELVVTPLGVEAMPLVRYRTGDMVRLHTGPCSCGWNTPRIGPVEGRRAYRLKCKGTTIYPESVFFALSEEFGIDAAYLEIRDGYELSDHVTLVAGGAEDGLRAEEVARRLAQRLRVRVEVRMEDTASVEAAMTAHGGRKPKKIFDFRQGSAGSSSEAAVRREGGR